MRAIAFIKKEVTEQIRSGKMMLLLILFLLFGIMNPAIAKLTPWMLQLFADSLEDSGMIVTEVTVSAMDSWVQFFKNVPMALIAFVLIESGIFTREYQSGTLVLSLTKGLERYKVVLSKATVLIVLWSVGYWLCFAVTYGYNAYFWDNSIAQSLFFSVVCWWIFGLWAVSLLLFFSTLLSSSGAVLACTGGTVLASYVVGLLPDISKLVPTALSEGTRLIYGTALPEDHTAALVITLIMLVSLIASAIPIFNKRNL